MKTIPIIQGSDDWLAFRSAHFNASDAAAMLGVSPYKTRAALLKEYATGITPEPDEAAQRRFAEGHRLEALARGRAEEDYGEELYPVVGVHDHDEKIAASFDGVTMDGTLIWEHKTLSAKLKDAEELPKYIFAQVQQQLMVSGAEAAAVWATNASGENRKWMLHPDYVYINRLKAGWAQFEKDLAAWQPEPETAPEIVGKAPETLPALRIEVSGQVTASNLAEFKGYALEVIRGVNTDLKTDNDFADAEKAVKWCKDVESRLANAKEAVLSQMADVHVVSQTLDSIGEETRQTRLTLEKMLKTRKEEIRIKMVSETLYQFKEQVNLLQEEIEREPLGKFVGFNPPLPSFAESIKGLKTLASVQNALDTALANAKIEVSEAARELRKKLAWFGENAGEYIENFRDLYNLVGKPFDDFQNVVLLRIEDIKKREAAKLEAERERIRQEEAEKAAKAQQEAERQAAQAQQVKETPGKLISAEAKLKETPESVPLVAESPANDETVESCFPMPVLSPETAQDMAREFVETQYEGKDKARILAVILAFVKFCLPVESVLKAA